MLAVTCKVGQDPVIEEITGGLENLQSLVGGYIEAVYLCDQAVMYCNEDGMDGEFNRSGIMGDFVVVGSTDDGENCSLTPAQAQAIVRYLDATKDVPHPSMTGEPLVVVAFGAEAEEMRRHAAESQEAIIRRFFSGPEFLS